MVNIARYKFARVSSAATDKYDRKRVAEDIFIRVPEIDCVDPNTRYVFFFVCEDMF